MNSFSLKTVKSGDLLLCYIEVDPGPATVTTVTSSNTDWVRVAQAIGGDGKDYELWAGKVTAAATDTVSLTFNGSAAASNVETGCQEFTSTRGSNWYVDTSGFLPWPDGTTISYPALYARNSGSLNWAYGKTTDVGSAGSTSGYSYSVTPQENVVCWSADVPGSQAPTAVTSDGSGYSIAVVVTDHAPASGAYLTVV